MADTGHVVPASGAWPEVPFRSQQVFAARNANEARLFLQCHGGEEIESRAVENEMHVLARHPEGQRVHRFTPAGGAPWRLAAAALREAAKLLPPGGLDEVRFFTGSAKSYAQADPDRFTAAALQSFAAAMDRHAEQWQRL